ncbi:geranyllinalool synthase [Sarracenia purpurea var. burkii]
MMVTEKSFVARAIDGGSLVLRERVRRLALLALSRCGWKIKGFVGVVWPGGAGLVWWPIWAGLGPLGGLGGLWARVGRGGWMGLGWLSGIGYFWDGLSSLAWMGLLRGGFLGLHKECSMGCTHSTYVVHGASIGWFCCCGLGLMMHGSRLNQQSTCLGGWVVAPSFASLLQRGFTDIGGFLLLICYGWAILLLLCFGYLPWRLWALLFRWGSVALFVGLAFVRKNMERLLKDKHHHHPCWFIVVFPVMIELAQSTGLDVLTEELKVALLDVGWGLMGEVSVLLGVWLGRVRQLLGWVV